MGRRRQDEKGLEHAFYPGKSLLFCQSVIRALQHTNTRRMKRASIATTLWRCSERQDHERHHRKGQDHER